MKILMPKIQKTRTTAVSKRRTAAPKARRTPTLRLQKNVVPKEVYVPMHYGDYWPLDCAASTWTSNTFRLNSIFDPDATGAGGQPAGYDQYTQMYLSYRVRAVDIELRAVNSCAQNVLLLGLAYAPGYTTPSTGTTVQQIVYEGDSDLVLRGFMSPSTVQGSSCVVRKHITMKQILGPVADMQDAQSAFGDNPTVVASMMVAICNFNGTTVGATAGVIVRITYYTELYGYDIPAED